MRANKLVFVFASVVLSAFLCGAPLAFAAEQDQDPESSAAYEDVFPGVPVDGDGTLSLQALEDALDASAPGPTAVVPENGYGVFTWANGDSYSGSWKSGKMHGKGVYTFANGAALSGEFKKNRIESGTYRAQVNANSFVLSVKNGRPTKAQIKLDSGFAYKGAFSKGKLNGKGKARFASGAKYSGSFKNGKRVGKGTYKWASGAKYVGSWKKDKMNGSGTYYYPPKSKAKKLVGVFSANKPKGTCTYTLRSGKTYKTIWKKGKCVKVTR